MKMIDANANKWHDLEKRALLLDREAIIILVSAFRRYRNAAEAVAVRGWGDGTIDGAAASAFAAELESIAEDTL